MRAIPGKIIDLRFILFLASDHLNFKHRIVNQGQILNVFKTSRKSYINLAKNRNFAYSRFNRVPFIDLRYRYIFLSLLSDIHDKYGFWFRYWRYWYNLHKKCVVHIPDDSIDIIELAPELKLSYRFFIRKDLKRPSIVVVHSKSL